VGIPQGRPGATKFYVIEAGKAGVYFDEAAPPATILVEDDHFGEGALLTGAARSASIRAEAPLDLLVIARTHFPS